MKKILKYLIISLFIFPITVFAKVWDVDNTVILNKDLNSSHVSVGQTVKSNSKIDGINTLIGKEIRHEGTSDYLISIGESIDVNGTVEKDMFVVGQDITLGSDIILKRDLYVIGQNIKILSNIDGDIRMAGTTLDLRGVTVKGNVYTYADKIILNSKTTINGKLSYLEDATVSGLDRAKVNKTKTIASNKNENIKERIFFFISNFITRMIAAFIVLALVIALMPNLKKKLDKEEVDFKHVLSLLGRGIVVILVIPFISLAALFTGILTPAALIILALYFIAAYISTLLVAYKVGQIIGKKLNVKNTYLSALLGIIVIYLIELIPGIGAIISIAALFIGLGFIYNYTLIKDKK